MESRRLTPFFVLLALLSLLFYLLGALAPTLSQHMPVHLLISALMFICPVITAVLLTWNESGSDNVKSLLKRTFDGHRTSMTWLLVACLIVPLVTLIAYLIQRGLGQQLPEFPFPWLAALAYFLLYFIAATGEELGWTGYVLTPLEKRFGVLRAALFFGTVWGLWHIVPYLQMGRSIEWVFWSVLLTRI